MSAFLGGEKWACDLSDTNKRLHEMLDTILFEYTLYTVHVFDYCFYPCYQFLFNFYYLFTSFNVFHLFFWDPCTSNPYHLFSLLS